MASTNDDLRFQVDAISQFDSLRAQGRLFYDETEAEVVDSSGYKLQFRRIPCFDEKPTPEDGSKPKGNPFAEALEEDFIVSRTESHVLQLNKFCVYRPQFILHTKDFTPQADPLSLSDFEATCHYLSQLDDPYIAFYNCGLDGGSSQPHKHLQLIPKPSSDEFVLFPDFESTRTNAIADDLGRDLNFSQPSSSSKVPFYCVLSYLPKDASPQGIHGVYKRMLNSPHPDYPDLTGHNMIMTADWICVIPRRRRLMLGVPANAMGMMGLIWVGTWSERVGWTIMGKTWHLEALGCPPLTPSLSLQDRSAFALPQILDA